MIGKGVYAVEIRSLLSGTWLASDRNELLVVAKAQPTLDELV